MDIAQKIKSNDKLERHTFRYSFFNTPVGDALTVSDNLGIRALELVRGEPDNALEYVKKRLKIGNFIYATDSEQVRAQEYIHHLLSKRNEEPVEINPPKIQPLGTPFQLEVWQAMTQLRKGETITYSQLALRIGRPAAARAVGNAVGANPIGIIIPCHRIIKSDGKIGGFRWGVENKRLLLALENVSL